MTSDVSDRLAAWWAGVPSQHRDTFERLDALIRDVADSVDAGPVEVTLAWGQPSYRSSRSGESTPVRLGWTDDGDVALLAHCQSQVIPTFREVHGDDFRTDGNRAVLLGPDDTLDDRREAALAELVRHALTYRRR